MPWIRSGLNRNKWGGNDINKRLNGNEHENLAVDFLTKNNLKILDRNFRCKIGEIDIIAKDGRYLVFIEVKYRSSSQMGDALAAVDYRKMKKICRVSDYYRLINKISEDCFIRYDVVAITGYKIEWIRNAFEYV